MSDKTREQILQENGLGTSEVELFAYELGRRQIVEKTHHLTEVNKVLVEALEDIKNYRRGPTVTINGRVVEGHNNHEIDLRYIAEKAIAKAKEMSK